MGRRKRTELRVNSRRSISTRSMVPRRFLNTSPIKRCRTSLTACQHLLPHSIPPVTLPRACHPRLRYLTPSIRVVRARPRLRPPPPPSPAVQRTWSARLSLHPSQLLSRPWCLGIPLEVLRNEQEEEEKALSPLAPWSSSPGPSSHPYPMSCPSRPGSRSVSSAGMTTDGRMWRG